MDSFYEEPRTPPVQRSYQDISLGPTVPEVSMISPNVSQNTGTDSMYLTYASLKARNQNTVNPNPVPCIENRDVDFGTCNDALRKQVRFQNGNQKLQQAAPYPVAPSTNRNVQLSNGELNRYENKTETSRKVGALPAKPLYEVYIPNKKLDLSIIEPPTKENVSPNVNSAKSTRQTFSNFFDAPRKTVDCNELNYNPRESPFKQPFKTGIHKPDTFQRRALDDGNKLKIPATNNTDETPKEKIRNNTFERNNVIDLYNYQRDNFTACTQRQMLNNTKFENCPMGVLPKKMYRPEVTDAVIQTDTESNLQLVEQHNNGPTVTDLLKLIEQQNQQLLVLQKQVATLLSNREGPKQIEPPSRNLREHCIGASTQIESQEYGHKTRPARFPQKFALDVMTSFEVSIRRPQNFNNFCNKNGQYHHPKIWEVDSDGPNEGKNFPALNDNKDRSMDDTLPLTLSESISSPQSSIGIMEEYNSNDDSDQEVVADTACTFYNNIMGQVNKILKKPHISPSSSDSEADTFNENMAKEAQSAAVKYLKEIGVYVPDIEEISNEYNCESRSSDAAQQLLMKYLPDEQLAKLARAKDIPQRCTEKPRPIKRRPDFSFASIQHMRKYNLLSEGESAPRIYDPPTRDQSPSRILDLTALRRQPKLL